MKVKPTSAWACITGKSLRVAHISRYLPELEALKVRRDKTGLPSLIIPVLITPIEKPEEKAERKR